MNNTKKSNLNKLQDKNRNFKKGDKVEIIGNIPFILKDKPRPLLGRVVHVDGFCVLVKPRYQRWIGEWYVNELRHAK